MSPCRSLASALAAAALVCGVGAQPAAAASTRIAAVYHVGDTGNRSVPPRDPGYKSLWPRATQSRGISVRRDTATIDLSAAAAMGQAGSGFACAALQQLVHTVTAANTSVSRVAFRINGRSSGAISACWGVGCGPDVPMTRQSAQQILAPVQISYLLHAQFIRSLTRRLGG